jgi:glycerol-3-phosphate acyltransferase PlsY
MVVVLLVPVAWLLGTFPSALLVARAHGRDVLHEGSGNPGASNVARLLHKASLASLLATVLFPIAVAAMRYDAWEIGVVSALAVLVITRHLGNIRRLLRRQEIDLGAPPS